MFGACVVVGHHTASIMVSGEGSWLEAEGCMVREAAWGAVLVREGGSASLTACQLTGSKKGTGLSVSYPGSRVTAKQCSMSANGGCGCNVFSAASVELLSCTLSGNSMSSLNALDADSTVVAKECSMSGNVEWGVSAWSGARLHLVNNGMHGLQVSGAGSAVHLQGVWRARDGSRVCGADRL